MRSTLSLTHREFSAYFLSPIAYVVLAVFLAVTGHLFYLTLGQLTASGPKGVEFPMQVMLGDANFWLVFLFIAPPLTMRLFAEERSTGTLEMLMTAPLTDWQVVLSKYVACFAFYLVLWVPTLVYLPVFLNWDWQTMRPRPGGSDVSGAGIVRQQPGEEPDRGVPVGRVPEPGIRRFGNLAAGNGHRQPVVSRAVLFQRTAALFP
jgi:hypothetical protein